MGNTFSWCDPSAPGPVENVKINDLNKSKKGLPMVAPSSEGGVPMAVVPKLQNVEQKKKQPKKTSQGSSIARKQVVKSIKNPKDHVSKIKKPKKIVGKVMKRVEALERGNQETHDEADLQPEESMSSSSLKDDNSFQLQVPSGKQVGLLMNTRGRDKRVFVEGFSGKSSNLSYDKGVDESIIGSKLLSINGVKVAGWNFKDVVEVLKRTQHVPRILDFELPSPGSEVDNTAAIIDYNDL